MSILRTVTTTAFGLALMGAVFSPVANADEWNRKTVMTFSGPVEIPGVHLKGWGVLPAGTYVFKILDTTSDRHIVQIFNQDQTQILATILAIPNYRLTATGKTVVTFSERPAGEPEALRAWFYPGRQWGEEFVYPRAKAMELAKTANAPVLFTAVDIPVEVTEPIKTADEPVVVQLKQAPVMAIKPTGEEVELAQVVTPPPAQEPVAVQQAEPVQVAATQLPKTGSELPLIELLGLLALGGGWTLRLVQKRLS
jgi:LPXTG-motif cell wall-anchored protein